ncbi:MAG: SoxR reducing system RseC family protein [Planctomycetes bacterium]|nr:SoxR reducing system RseC family protein [Planctomycetota bacterium]
METIIETGTVFRIPGKRAQVRLDRRPDEHAAECRGCTACRQGGDSGPVLEVPADGLAEGDRVRLAIPTPGPWRGILMVFALPLAAGMAGLLGGAAWTGFQQATGLGQESAGLVLGAGLGLAAFALAVAEERRFARRNRPAVLHVERAGQPPAAAGR